MRTTHFPRWLLLLAVGAAIGIALGYGDRPAPRHRHHAAHAHHAKTKTRDAHAAAQQPQDNHADEGSGTPYRTLLDLAGVAVLVVLAVWVFGRIRLRIWRLTGRRG